MLLESEPATLLVPGDMITYTIRYTNTNLAPVTDLTLASSVPAGMVLLTDSLSVPAIVVTQDEQQTLHWSVSELASQRGGALRYRVQRPALVTPPRASIVQLQTAAPLTATAGLPVTYTIQLTNTRPFPLRNLVVVNQLPAGATLVDDGEGEVMGDQIQWTLRQLPALGTVTFHWQVTATQSLVNAGAWVRVDGGPAITSNRVLTAIDDILPRADLLPIHHAEVQFTWYGDGQEQTLHTQALEQWLLP